MTIRRVRRAMLNYIILLGLSGFCVGQTKAKDEIFVGSVARLIAAPDRYQDVRVLVTGYCRMLFEGTAIYSYKEDFEKNLGNQVWWDFRQDQLTAANQRIGHCIVEGTFNISNRGHLGMYFGSIEKITRYEPWPPRGVKQHR